MRDKHINIAELSIVMSQSKVQTDTSIAAAKISIDANRETGTQMTEVISNYSVDPNLGNNIDGRV